VSDPLADDEFVRRFEAHLAHQRARHAAWQLAIEDITITPLSRDVVPVFDTDAMLVQLYIEPTVMTRYTHTELEELITRSLQHTRDQMKTQISELFAKYLAPGDPLFEPHILGTPYVELPE